MRLTGQLVGIDERSYRQDGREQISYTACVLEGLDMVRARIDDAALMWFNEQVGKEVDLIVRVSAYKSRDGAASVSVRVSGPWQGQEKPGARRSVQSVPGASSAG